MFVESLLMDNDEWINLRIRAKFLSNINPFFFILIYFARCRYTAASLFSLNLYIRALGPLMALMDQLMMQKANLQY